MTAPPPSNVTRFNQKKWLYLYLLQAVFVVFTLAVGNWFAHRLISAHRDSVTINRQWVKRLMTGDELARQASAAVKPVNDVVQSRDPAAEAVRLRAALALFDNTVTDQIQELQVLLDPEKRQLTQDCRKVETEMEHMVGTANLVFAALRDSEMVRAGERLTAVNNAYDNVLVALNQLRTHYRAHSAVFMDAQQAAAGSMSQLEDIMLGLALMAVAGFTVLGVRLSRQIRATEAQVRAKSQELAESRKFVQETMDSLQAHVCVVAEDGTLLAVNQAWRDFAAANPPIVGNIGMGADYLAICDATTGPDAESARAFATGIRAVMAGTRDQFELEYPCHSPRQHQWFVGRVTRLIGETTRRVVVAHENNTARKQAELYRDMAREVLQILNEPGDAPDSIQRVLATLKTRTGFDAIGIRLQAGNDFPYFVQEGFPTDFLRTENTLVERAVDGGLCQDKDGNVRLECTCGLVIAGKLPLGHPLFTPGGSFWTNDSFPLLNLSTDQDPRLHPRNNCIHQGYASVALTPIRNNDKIVGLIQFNDQRNNCFTREAVELLEQIAAHIGGALLRKQAEELVRAKNQELEQFTYAVSHDLRSPVVTIQTFLDYLKQDIADQNTVRVTADMNFIYTAASKMALLLDELLKLSRLGHQKNPPADVLLQVVVKEALDLVAGRISQRGVQVTMAKDPVTLHGDRARFVAVFQNLVDNACKFMGDQKEPCVEIGVETRAAEPVYFVRDNGGGIDPRHQAKLFGLFVRLNSQVEGTGIGLVLVKRIVELQGGRIWVESKGIGQGSCFCFTLPSTIKKTNEGEKT